MRVTLGHFGALWGDCGATLADFWTFWGDFEVTLEPLMAYEGDLGRPRCLGNHSGPTLGPFCYYFGATWVPFLALEGRCKGLRSHFELTWGSLLAYENDFGIIMVSS